MVVYVGVVSDGQPPARLLSAEGVVVFLAIAGSEIGFVKESDARDDFSPYQEAEAIQKGDPGIELPRLLGYESPHPFDSDALGQVIDSELIPVDSSRDRLPRCRVGEGTDD